LPVCSQDNEHVTSVLLADLATEIIHRSDGNQRMTVRHGNYSDLDDVLFRLGDLAIHWS